MAYLCQHLVPKMLTLEHKEAWITFVEDLITLADESVDF
jgi:hypothetical protein